MIATTIVEGGSAWAQAQGAAEGVATVQPGDAIVAVADRTGARRIRTEGATYDEVAMAIGTMRASSTSIRLSLKRMVRRGVAKVCRCVRIMSQALCMDGAATCPTGRLVDRAALGASHGERRCPPSFRMERSLNMTHTMARTSGWACLRGGKRSTIRPRLGAQACLRNCSATYRADVLDGWGAWAGNSARAEASHADPSLHGPQQV